jgi:hypothetical protein
MSELQIILERLNRVEEELAALKAAPRRQPKGAITSAEALEFERLPSTAVVGKRYAAYRFGCSERAVMRREAGTHLIKWSCRKPFKATKSEIDRAHREHTKPVERKAAEIRAKTNVRHRSALRKAA